MSSQITVSCPSAARRSATSLRVTTIRIGERAAESLGVVADDAPGPRAVLGSDEADEHLAVVVGRDGGEATPTDHGDDGALGLDASARLLVVGRRDEVLLARADLQRNRSLGSLAPDLL